MPCTKGMTGCAALCGHRAHVQAYREERSRQWDQLIEFTGGYDTEIADRLRELREQGTPLIDYKTWLKQSARPPEDRDMPENNGALSTALVDGKIIGDPAAEQMLLATVMENPEQAPVLLQLQRGEFTEPLHQVVYDAIHDLHTQDIEVTAVAVESWMRETGAISRTPDWDSMFYRPDQAGESVTILRDGGAHVTARKDLGLRGWHESASNSPDGAQWLTSVIRDNTIMRQTVEAHDHAAAALKDAFAHGTDPCDIGQVASRVSWEFEATMRQIPPALPGQRVHEQVLAEYGRPGSASGYATGHTQAAQASLAASIRR